MRKENMFWGLLFVLLGVFLVVSKLELIPNVNVFSLLVTAFLVIVILKSIPHLNFAGMLFPIAFISIIFDKQLGITSITPWTVLIAAALGSIGLSMIFHKPIKWANKKFHHEDFHFEKVDVEDGNNVGYSNSFSGSVKYVNTDNFENADFKCSFGALKVYFDNATMSGNNAVVRIDANCSGIELYIPRGWKIENRVNVFLGAIDEKNKNNELTTNTLTLIGDVRLSGVEIFYV